MNKFTNILLINFGGIGDEILFLPVVQSLKKKFPQSKITLCLESRSRAFLDLTTKIDDYFFVDIKTKNKYFEMLKLYFKALFGKYDLVISSGSNPLISILLFFTGIKTRIGYKTSKLSEKLLSFSVKLNKNQYSSMMYFDLVRPVTNSDFELPFLDFPEVERKQNTVLIHPGVSKISVMKKNIKTFSADKWAELIKLILTTGKQVILVGGPDDFDCISKIREQLQGADLSNFIDMYGKTKNIIDLVKIIKQSEVLICSDSAPMHIGVSTDTKTIAIFGPTDDSVLIPKSDKFIAIKNNVDCRPCLWEKRLTTCDELSCLNINLEKIVELI